MAEFCLDCLNRMSGRNDDESYFVLSKDLELCEGCGQWKKIVITRRQVYYTYKFGFLIFIIQILRVTTLFLWKVILLLYMFLKKKLKRNKKTSHNQVVRRFLIIHKECFCIRLIRFSFYMYCELVGRGKSAHCTGKHTHKCCIHKLNKIRDAENYKTANFVSVCVKRRKTMVFNCRPYVWYNSCEQDNCGKNPGINRNSVENIGKNI